MIGNRKLPMGNPCWEFLLFYHRGVLLCGSFPPKAGEGVRIVENPMIERNKKQRCAKHNVTNAPASPDGEIFCTCTASPREGGPSQAPKFLLPSVHPSSPWLLHSLMHQSVIAKDGGGSRRGKTSASEMGSPALGGKGLHSRKPL